MSPIFFSGNIANMIPEGPLNKMVPLTEDHGVCTGTPVSSWTTTLGFNILRKDNYKPRRETLQFRDLVPLILKILRYCNLLRIDHCERSLHPCNDIVYYIQNVVNVRSLNCRNEFVWIHINLLKTVRWRKQPNSTILPQETYRSGSICLWQVPTSATLSFNWR